MPPRKRTSRKTTPLAALEKQMAVDGVEFVRFEQSDTHGISRSKTIPVGHVRDFAEGLGAERRLQPAEPLLVVLLACEGNELQRAQWNKLSRQHGRARLSLVATTTNPGCVLVEFGTHGEPFPADVLRILDARFEQEKSR